MVFYVRLRKINIQEHERGVIMEMITQRSSIFFYVILNGIIFIAY